MVVGDTGGRQAIETGIQYFAVVQREGA